MWGNWVKERVKLRCTVVLHVEVDHYRKYRPLYRVQTRVLASTVIKLRSE